MYEHTNTVTTFAMPYNEATHTHTQPTDTEQENICCIEIEEAFLL